MSEELNRNEEVGQDEVTLLQINYSILLKLEEIKNILQSLTTLTKSPQREGIL